MADKVYLPRQHVRRGKAGYRDFDGRIEVVDGPRTEATVIGSKSTPNASPSAKPKGGAKGRISGAAATDADTPKEE